MGGVKIDSITSSGLHEFSFNTVAGNTGVAGANTGVDCSSVFVPLSFSNSIVYGNTVGGTGAQVGGAMCSWSYSVLVTAAIFVAPRAAGADCMIVEAHAGQRPSNADEILRPIRERLLAHGCRDAQEFLPSMPFIYYAAPAIDAGKAKELERDARDGFQKYVDGRYDEAIAALEPLAETFANNPRITVDYPNLRTAHRLALVGIAMTHRKLAEKQDVEIVRLESEARKVKRDPQKLGEINAAIETTKAESAKQAGLARDFMATLARVFAKSDIQRTEFGGETADFFEEEERDLANEGTAELSVTMHDDASGIIFVNSEYANVGSVEMKLPPGPATVLVRWGSGPTTVARFYKLDLKSGVIVFGVSRRYAETLHTGPDWCCLLYPSLDHWKMYVDSDIPYFFPGKVDRVVVLSFESNAGGLRALVGRVYENASPRPRRQVRLALASIPSEQTRAKFAAYLLEPGDGAPIELADAEDSTGGSTVIAKVVAGTGALALIAGNVLEPLTDRRFDDDASTIRDPNVQAVVLAGAGSCALGTGVALWLRNARHVRGRAAAAMGAGIAATTLGATLVLTDEDVNPIGPQSKYYRDTAPPGYIVGAAGLVLVGVGIWQWGIDEPRTEKHAARVLSMPVVSRQPRLARWVGACVLSAERAAPRGRRMVNGG